MADGKVSLSANSTKPIEQRYFNQLRRAYNSIAGTNLPYTESTVKNKYGDVIMIYRDYHLDDLPKTAAEATLDECESQPNGGEFAVYWYTIAQIALGRVKFVWNDKGVHRGASTLIFGHKAPEERKQRISYIATAEKGGVYPEAYAHSLWEGVFTGSDTQDTLDGVLEAIRNCSSVGDAQQLVVDHYIKDNIQEEYEDVPF